MRDLPDLATLRSRDLTRRQRLVALYGLGLLGVVLLYTGLYYLGMRALEGEPRSLFQSFNVVIETMTTTGYGSDAPWSTPAMNLFVAAMQVTGVGIGFVTLRVLIIPLFERTPLNLDDRLSIKRDHVVVAEYQRDTEVLLDELEALDVDYVLVESDETEAKRLSDDGYQTIHGDPETRRDLDRATIGRASVLVTDAGDRTASVVLTALEANEDLRVLSFTPSTRRKAALAEIGVDRSVAPHALIGRRLAEKATTLVSDETAGSGEDIAVREVLVRRDSALEGVRVGDSPFARHAELTLVAGWFDGELQIPPAGGERLTANSVLVVAGPAAAIDAVSGAARAIQSLAAVERATVVVAGFGEGGKAAVEALPEGVRATTVDEDPTVDPDVVGDVTEPETLEAASVADATAVIVTVGDDASALLTVAMARSLAPDAEVLASVVSTEKAPAAFRAGADYVLSVQRVCARLAAAEVHGERVMDPVSQIRLIRSGSARFAGETLGEARSRRRGQGGWTLVAVVRDGTVFTEAGTPIGEEDDVLVAGSDEGIQRFEQANGGS